jgi:hypothetical protein
MWASVAYSVLITLAQLTAVDAYTGDSVKASTGCTAGYNASSALLGSEDDGAKLASRKLGRTLLQDSSKLVALDVTYPDGTQPDYIP